MVVYTPLFGYWVWLSVFSSASGPGYFYPLAFLSFLVRSTIPLRLDFPVLASWQINLLLNNTSNQTNPINPTRRDIKHLRQRQALIRKVAKSINIRRNL